MRELFSPADGIGLSMLRQPMGASDFAVGRAYSYDDQPAGQTDPDLSEFSIAPRSGLHPAPAAGGVRAQPADDLHGHARGAHPAG